MGDQCWCNASVPFHVGDYDPSFREIAFISVVMDVVINVSQVLLPQVILDGSMELMQAYGLNKKTQDEILSVLQPFIIYCVTIVCSLMMQQIKSTWKNSPKILVQWFLLALVVIKSLPGKKIEKVDSPPVKKDHEPRGYVTELGVFRNKEEAERALWQEMGFS